MSALVTWIRCLPVLVSYIVRNYINILNILTLEQNNRVRPEIENKYLHDLDLDYNRETLTGTFLFGGKVMKSTRSVKTWCWCGHIHL